MICEIAYTLFPQAKRTAKQRNEQQEIIINGQLLSLFSPLPLFIHDASSKPRVHTCQLLSLNKV